MSVAQRVPNLKEVLGAMIFAANRPLTVREMRTCLVEVAQTAGDHTMVFATVKDGDVRAALAELGAELESRRSGFLLAEISAGFRLQSDESCGVWLKHLLNIRKTNRLSQPSLETLAIIACRQPVGRTEIEGIRGVNVDHVIKSLMELQLVRIVGRSDLPGRPFLFGTTQLFLDHFGLKSLDSLGDLTGMKLQARKPTVAEAGADVTDSEPELAMTSEGAAPPAVAAGADEAEAAPAAESTESHESR